MGMSLHDGDSSIQSASEYGARHCRFCSVGDGNRVAMGSTAAPSNSFFTIRHVALCGGGWNPKYSAGGGKRWEVEQGKALLGKCMQIQE